MGHTHKKFTKQVFDDDKYEHQRKAAGKKGHSTKHYDPSDEIDIDDSDKYSEEIKYFLKI